MPLLLLLAPLAEIAIFILVGRAIGIFPTLMLVVLSAILGMTMLRDAGLLTVERLRRGIGSPDAVLAEGGTRMAAGILFLIPGFLSDLLAIALLIPSTRKLFRRNGSGQPPQPGRPTVIDGEFRRLDP